MPYDTSRYTGAAPQGYNAQQLRQPVQQVQQQYGAAANTMRGSFAGSPQQPQPRTMSGGAMPNMYDPQARAMSELQRSGRIAAEQAGVGAAAASELARRDATRDELYGRAREREQEVRQDPLDAAITQELQRRVGGAGPITDDVRNALFSQNTDQTAAMAANQMQALGGRPGDPAFEARRSELELGRQRGNVVANRELGLQQSLQNYSAQGEALSQGANINAARQGRITEADRRVQELLANEQFGVALPTQQLSIQDYLRMRGA